MAKLHPYEQGILETLDETGGFATKDVAKNVPTKFGRNGHEHSSDIRAWLLDMEKRGLVAKLDDLKPVAWKRTPRGSEALACAGVGKRARFY